MHYFGFLSEQRAHLPAPDSSLRRLGYMAANSTLIS